jgi:hypothetical protein
MKRRKPVSRINVMPSRSLAWATQLRQRYVRFADFQRLRMLLYVPALARTLVSLQQRWFTSLVHLHPQLNLSLKEQSVVNAWTNHVTAPRLTLLNVFSLAHLAATSSSAHNELRRTRYIRDYEDHQRLALTLAINRTSSDLTTTFSQKFHVQREARVREISTLLTQRVKRISEPAAPQTPLALRAPVASRATAAEPALEVMRSRDGFERRNAPVTMPAQASPAINVEMLANEVMKQIDRRVIARRERMGQI